MRPTLIDLAGLQFHAYPVMLAVAFLVCVTLAVRECLRADPPINATTKGGIWIFIGALFGAKLFWHIQFTDPEKLAENPLILLNAFLLWRGGLVYYGGLAGGMAGAVLYLAVNRLPILRVADIGGPYLALGQGITRIGCFLNGCCWGKVAGEHVPWAVQFPHDSLAYRQQIEDGLIKRTPENLSLPVHPTQLYMVVGLLSIAVLLKFLLDRKDRLFAFHGGIALLYLLFYGVLRFVVEEFRGDSAESVLDMTLSQTISLGLVVFAVAALVLPRALNVQHREPTTEPAEALAEDAPEEEEPGKPTSEATAETPEE